MAEHKAPDGSIHDDDEGRALSNPNWPKGCILLTKAEADAIRAASVIKPTYAQLRAAEYPPMADYLDAIVKGDLVQQQAYLDACLAVKAKYPKI